jgi:protein SCO1/2
MPSRRAFVALLSGVALAAGTTGAAMGASGRPGADDGRIPDVELTTHERRVVRFYGDLVKGRVVVVNFMYTSCADQCPLTTANLVAVQEMLGDRVGRDIFLYSVTLDPARDTPDVLKRYAERHGVKPGWTFLTGKRPAIETLRRALGVYDRDPAVDADRSQHAGLLVYGNDALRRWAAAPALAAPGTLIRGIRRVAGEGTRESRADSRQR